MFLRFHRLTENRIATAVLFLHRARSLFHVIKRFRLDRRRMGDNAPRGGINFHDCAAARTAHVKTRFLHVNVAFDHK